MNTKNKFIKISILTIIFLFGVTHILFAETILKKDIISVTKNAVNIEVKGKQVIKIGEEYKTSKDKEIPSTIIYEDNAYISVKKMGQILNLKIDWDNDSRTIAINKDNFVKSNIDDIKSNINTDKLTVFYIGSPNCPACITYKPKLNKVIDQFKYIDSVSYINTEELSEEEKKYLKNKFNLRYIPVTLFIQRGEVLEKIVGDITEETLYEKIEKVLNNSTDE